MTVVALDPGISTGVAIHTDGRVYSSPQGTEVDTSEYLMLVVTDVPKLWSILEHHMPHTVVMENFASGGLISKDGQATIRLIGAMELAAYILGCSLVLQAPQERYRFMEAARGMLKQRGKTPISHEVDALAHLLLYEWRIENNMNTGLRRHTWQR
jgi:hypothetical protein